MFTWQSVACPNIVKQEIAVRVMILLPRAAGTVKAPPLIKVPVGAVVKVRCDSYRSQLNRKVPPGSSIRVAASRASRDGALVALINLANWSMSFSGSSAHTTFGLFEQVCRREHHRKAPFHPDPCLPV